MRKPLISPQNCQSIKSSSCELRLILYRFYSVHSCAPIKLISNVINYYFFLNVAVHVCIYRSCRVAPLVACDYCPLLFHMDCLDPPMTSMPSGRWMCPNHLEHEVVSAKLIDWGLISCIYSSVDESG